MIRHILSLILAVLIFASAGICGHLTLRPVEFATVSVTDTMIATADLVYFDLSQLEDSFEVDVAELIITYSGNGEDGEPLEVLLAPPRVAWRNDVSNLELEDEPSVHSDLARFQTVLCGEDQQASLDVTSIVKSWLESEVTNNGVLIRAVDRKAGDLDLTNGQTLQVVLSVYFSRKVAAAPTQKSGGDTKTK